jgi:hypothetical protein
MAARGEIQVTIVTTRYQRKPIFVDVIQVTEKNFDEVAKWCQGQIMNGSSRYIRVRVHNPMRPRQTKAFVNDWILYSEHYGYKVYTDGAFRNAFEEVKDTKSVTEKVEELRAEGIPDGTYGGARQVN